MKKKSLKDQFTPINEISAIKTVISSKFSNIDIINLIASYRGHYQQLISQNKLRYVL